MITTIAYNTKKIPGIVKFVKLCIVIPYFLMDILSTINVPHMEMQLAVICPQD